MRYQYKYRGRKDGKVSRWVYAPWSTISHNKAEVEARAARRISQLNKSHPWARWEYKIEEGSQ